MKKTFTIIALSMLMVSCDSKKDKKANPTPVNPVSPTVVISCTSVPPQLQGIDASGPHLKLFYSGDLIITERQTSGIFQNFNVVFNRLTSSVPLNFLYTYRVSARQLNCTQSVEIQITMPPRNPDNSTTFIPLPPVVPPCSKTIENVCVVPTPPREDY